MNLALVSFPTCQILSLQNSFIVAIRNDCKSNQTEYSGHEKRSVIKSLVAEKYKPCEIYRWTCDIYEGSCFNENIFTNGLNTDLQQRIVLWKCNDSPVKKSFGRSSYWSRSCWHCSGIWKGPSRLISLKKGQLVPIALGKIHLIYWILIYIYIYISMIAWSAVWFSFSGWGSRR